MSLFTNDAMNGISKIEGKTYYEVERLQQLMTGDSIVICMDAIGMKFTCPSTLWDSNIIEEISTPAIIAKVNSRSTPAEKITLFRSLFRGREDVYARRYYSPKTDSGGYVPACKNEWVVGICDKKSFSCGRCPNRSFLSLTDDVIYRHLEGKDRYNRDVIGLYPILEDDTTYFLAIDFDGDDWWRDIDAF